jgi:uncharacterized protein YjbJ (UPF0337 family)
MNRDELEGKAEALKGKVKQAAGTLTHDADLHDEGVIDEVAGTQAAAGRVRRKVGVLLGVLAIGIAIGTATPARAQSLEERHWPLAG